MAAVPPFRRFLTYVVLLGLALVLFATRPRLASHLTASGVDENTQSCLSNLSQISRAYAQYALDYNGKLPLGVDPEDRFNPTTRASWHSRGLPFNPDQVPMLHQVLRPYVASPQVFHCPADVGWKTSRLAQTNPNPRGMSFGLIGVLPTSFQRYGTSYYCWTVYNLSLNTAADIEDPANKILLFDGDLWHFNAGRELMNVLCADGHVQNLTAAQFWQLSEG